MAFDCSVAFSDIDINCQAMDVGGIKAVVLGLQCDLTLEFDGTTETTVTRLDLTDYVRFEHNKKDGSTTFSESKTTTGGLGIINTDITIRLPRLDNKVNRLDYMSRRQDIVCLMLHNNGSITVSGFMDGLTMDYSATSGSGITDKSFVDVKLTTQSWISSLVLDDDTPLTSNIFG
jgi:hypothetical protein